MNNTAEFFEAIKSGKSSEVTAILQESPELANTKNDDNISALMFAIYCNQQEIVEELLAQGIKPDIWEASAAGKTKQVAEHISMNPSCINAYSADGFTPLGLAAFFGQEDVIELLLLNRAKTEVSSKNRMRVYPIHSAVAHREPTTALSIADFLLSEGAEVNVSQNGGWTPLHQAAAHGHLQLVQLLLSYGANINAKNDNDKTPLEMAIENKHSEVAKLLSS